MEMQRVQSKTELPNLTEKNSNQKGTTRAMSSDNQLEVASPGCHPVQISEYEKKKKLPLLARNAAVLHELGFDYDTLKTTNTNTLSLLNARNTNNDPDGEYAPDEPEEDEDPSKGKSEPRPQRACTLRKAAVYKEPDVNDLEVEVQVASRVEPPNSQTLIPKVPNAKPASRRQARTAKTSVSSTKNKRIKACITEQNTGDSKRWKDVKDWTDLGNGAFEYVLKFDRCKADHYFLMFCTAVTDESEDEMPWHMESEFKCRDRH